MKFRAAAIGILGAAMIAGGCSTAPKTESGKEKLSSNVETVMKQLSAKDPGLQGFLDSSYAYVIFPTVGKGGLVVGGSYGHGEVYEQKKLVGYADISQATVGAQIGGQEFTEIIAFQTQTAFNNFKKGQFKFAANASAVAMKSGAAATTKYTDGIAIFIDIRGGAMAEAAIGGQSFSYQPL